jgi:hypothetical protein
LEAGKPSLLALVIALSLQLVAAPSFAHTAAAKPLDAKPGERTHDGVFLRAGVSGGYAWLDYDAPMTTRVHHQGRAEGRSGSLELAMGGTLPGGLVLGGVWLIRPMSELEFSNSEVTAGWDSTSVALNEVAAFARYYPFPHYGLHVETLLGVVKYTIESEKRVLTSVPVSCIIVPAACFAAEFETVTVTESAWGYSLAIGAGYDLFIGKQWSFGFTGRAHFAHAWQNERSYWLFMPTLGLGFTYH